MKKKNIYNPSQRNRHSWLVVLCFAVLLTFDRSSIEQEVSPYDIRENKLSGNTLCQIIFFLSDSFTAVGDEEKFEFSKRG